MLIEQAWKSVAGVTGSLAIGGHQAEPALVDDLAALDQRPRGAGHGELLEIGLDPGLERADHRVGLRCATRS